MDARVPAVVVGGNLNGLGVVRSLCAGGMPIVVLDTSWRRPAMWSRSSRAVLVPRLHGPALVEALLRLRREFEAAPVLFLTDEMAVYTVSERRRELEGAYRFHLPPPETVTGLSDKARFQALAETLGFPVPRSAILETDADLHGLSDLSYPAVVKPTDKRPVHLGRAERIHRVSTHAEAQRLCADLLASGVSLIAQEWIPGRDGDIYFCLFYCGRDGNVANIFTGRKLRCDPPDIGSTGICLAAPEAGHALEALTRRFVRQTGFAGLGSLEFKRHSERNAFLIIEPTVGRTDWQEEIATLCGANIPLAAYGDALGLPIHETTPLRTDVAWRASVSQRWPPGIPRAGRRVYDGFWRLSDPMPAIFHYGLDAVLRRTWPSLDLERDPLPAPQGR